MSPQIKHDPNDLLTEYCVYMGINRDPRKIQQQHFKKLFTACVALSKANVHMQEPCIIATTTTDEDVIFAPEKASQPTLRETLGWMAARCIALGNFRVATAEEYDRYYVEQRAREEECRKIEAAKPHNKQAEIQRTEAQNTREMMRDMLATVSRTQGFQQPAVATAVAEPEPEKPKSRNKPAGGGE